MNTFFVICYFGLVHDYDKVSSKLQIEMAVWLEKKKIGTKIRNKHK